MLLKQSELSLGYSSTFLSIHMWAMEDSGFKLNYLNGDNRVTDQTKH